MKLIDGNCLKDKLEDFLKNPEELPDPRIADMIRMVDNAPMAFDIDNLLDQFDQKIKTLEEKAEKAEDADELMGMRMLLIIKEEVEKCREIVVSNMM